MAAAPYASSWQQEMRSVTPAIANTRQLGRYASAPRIGGGPAHDPDEPYASNRSLTPSRYMGGYERDESMAMAEARAPSSTGLIRLTLKKPMGIVFEPMYDPNQKTLQRGVRICDLPRTGAAALSRKLQVGDELLQINDKTVSRLNFDQIMDFIIEADPESVNLLFRRPRKETLQARQGVQQKLNAAANKDNPSTVKWVDEDQKEQPAKPTVAKKDKVEVKKDKVEVKKDKVEVKKDKVEVKKNKRSKKSSVSEDEEETIQSSIVGDDSFAKQLPKRSRKKSKSRRDPYENESFLDVLIDTICANSNNVCRDTFRREDEEFSEDEESFVTDAEDESTYVTYDDSLDARRRGKKKHHATDEEETSDDLRKNSSQRRDKHDKGDAKTEKNNYEDDGTVESGESTDRNKPEQSPAPLVKQTQPEPQKPTLPVQDSEEDGKPAPIKEVEYDDRIDHGADVSVMESLGGPSLLIEKQRAAMQGATPTSRIVPTEIIEKFGVDYPSGFGVTRQQAIEADPLKFYTYVVKGLLEEHEPEKVRLLDKLLAKYKGREDHLVQKLSVRYEHEPPDAPQPAPQTVDPKDDNAAFTEAVKKSKASSNAAAAVHTAKERMQHGDAMIGQGFENQTWPDKETKEHDLEDERDADVDGGDESESGSDYSHESVDGTSPAVIAQVSELLNYVYGKTSVPGQIDRVSTIMRAYEGREAVLLELLETKALIKANKEKENADNLPSFLRNSHAMVQSQKHADPADRSDMPPVTPMAATQPLTDDISSMSGVSSPAHEAVGVVNSYYHDEEVEVTHSFRREADVVVPMKEGPKLNTVMSSGSRSSLKPPVTPDKKKKKGLFGGLFGKKKTKEDSSTPASHGGSRARSTRKVKG